MNQVKPSKSADSMTNKRNENRSVFQIGLEHRLASDEELRGDLLRRMFCLGRADLRLTHTLLDIANDYARISKREYTPYFLVTQQRARQSALMSWYFVLLHYFDNAGFREYLRATIPNEYMRKRWDQIVDDGFVLLMCGNDEGEVQQTRRQKEDAMIASGALRYSLTTTATRSSADTQQQQQQQELMRQKKYVETQLRLPINEQLYSKRYYISASHLTIDLMLQYMSL